MKKTRIFGITTLATMLGSIWAEQADLLLLQLWLLGLFTASLMAFTAAAISWWTDGSTDQGSSR